MAFDLTALLTFAQQNGASDVHVSAGMPPLLRIRGRMTPVEMPALSSDDARAVLFDVLNDEQKKTFEATKDIDFAFEIPGVSRFRANLFLQHRGAGAVFRLIPNKILSLEELAMPKVLKDLASKEK